MDILSPYDLGYRDLKEFEISLERDVYLDSYYEFFKTSFGQLHPNDPLLCNWHIKILCDKIQTAIQRVIDRKPRIKHICINIPFRSSKSLIATISSPAWAWAKAPGLKFISHSAGEDLAIENSERSKEIITSQWYQGLFGDRVMLNPSSNNKKEFKNLLGGARKNVGTGTKITGFGADIIITDDPLDAQKADSEAAQEAALRYVFKTLPTRFNNASVGLHLLIMQRLHENDPSGRVLKMIEEGSESWEVIRIPGEFIPELILPPSLAELYPSKGSFFPQKFTQKDFKELKASLGSYDYEGQVNQRPMSPEDGIFKRKHFKEHDSTSLHIIEMIQNSRVHFYLDSAFTKKKENDPSAIMAAFTPDRGQNMYILHCDSYYKEFPELIRFLREYMPANGARIGSKLKVEPKASGPSVVQTLKLDPNLQVEEIKSQMVANDKESNAKAISPFVEAGRVHVIKSGEWVEDFFDEITKFPKGTVHDDRVDVLCYAVEDLLKPPKVSSILL